MEREFVTIYYHNNKMTGMKRGNDRVLHSKHADTLIDLHSCYDRSYRVWESNSPTHTELVIEFYNVQTSSRYTAEGEV